MIKNIILDMGRVLLSYDPDQELRRYFDTEEDIALIRKELFRGPEWAQGDLGEITNAQRYDGVAKRVPKRLHKALRLCVDNWDECMTPLDGAREFCCYVRGKGYGVYVLSNACQLFYEYFPRYYSLDFFDGIVVSSDIHIVKPDIRIYEYLLETYHLKAEECLFIDDRADNIEGAQRVGMQAEQFFGDFERIKEKYGL